MMDISIDKLSESDFEGLFEFELENRGYFEEMVPGRGEFMLINKAYKFRMYPNKEQAILINKTIGCSRFVFNHFLAKWNEAYKETGKGLTYSKCSKQLPSLKQEHEWLKEVDSIAVQSSVKNLSESFIRFFKKQNKAPALSQK